jgi:uncharacterized protein YeaO (DUF488 family)
MLVVSSYKDCNKLSGYTLIATSRTFPKDIDNLEWKKILAPSFDLLNWYKSNEKKFSKKEGTMEQLWERYKIRYLLEIKNPLVEQEINSIASRIKNGENIALLCYCDSKKYCHRYLLKEIVDKKVLTS